MTDVCIVGAGAAGCVLAARLSENPDRSVCLIEAGPDYGHLAEGRWPADLLDASDCATSHDWGYGGETCCRVVGGCSAHNGCLVVWGTPDDYDGWGEDWGFAALRPYLERAQAVIGTRQFEPEEVGAWTRRALDGWTALGVPRLHDLNATDAIAGAGLIPVNRRGRLRLGAAIAYLDPARARPNLTILADALADRVVVTAGRATGVVVRHGGGERLIEAGTVILAAGPYGSPAVLLRSGIGPATELEPLGIPVVVDIAGVGRNLHDHPAVAIELEHDEALAAELAEDDSRGALTHVQATLKAASPWCRPGTFDLQLLPNVAWERSAAGVPTGRHRVSLIPVELKPRSRGVVRLASADPADVPVIDRRLFTDPAGHDLGVLMEGVERARALAATGPIASVTGPADWPDESAVRANAFTLFHPVGTCAMGSVVDSAGRVAGVEGLRVCDASIVPEVPRANTHLTVLAIAEAIASRLPA